MGKIATSGLGVHLDLPEAIFRAEDDVELADLKPLVLIVLTQDQPKSTQVPIQFPLSTHDLQVEADLIRDVLVSARPCLNLHAD